MLYSVLDSGNFFVIPGSPTDVWVAEIYAKAHSKIQSRERYGFGEDDLVVLVVGSSTFYNELPWDHAVAMHSIGPLLIKYARRKGQGGSFKFVFLCGNSTGGYNDVLQVCSKICIKGYACTRSLSISLCLSLINTSCRNSSVFKLMMFCGHVLKNHTFWCVLVKNLPKLEGMLQKLLD